MPVTGKYFGGGGRGLVTGYYIVLAYPKKAKLGDSIFFHLVTLRELFYITVGTIVNLDVLVRIFDDVDAKNEIVERKVFGRDNRRLGQQPVQLSCLL